MTDRTTDMGSPSGTPHTLSCGSLIVPLRKRILFMVLRKIDPLVSKDGRYAKTLH